jgi:hypothetical protein
LALARHREAGLDHIDTQPGELARHFKFLARRHGRAGALLAVAERRVKNDDAVVLHISFMFWRRGFRKTKTPPPVWQWGLEKANSA